MHSKVSETALVKIQDRKVNKLDSEKVASTKSRLPLRTSMRKLATLQISLKVFWKKNSKKRLRKKRKAFSTQDFFCRRRTFRNVFSPARVTYLMTTGYRSHPWTWKCSFFWSLKRNSGIKNVLRRKQSIAIIDCKNKITINWFLQTIDVSVSNQLLTGPGPSCASTQLCCVLEKIQNFQKVATDLRRKCGNFRPRSSTMYKDFDVQIKNTPGG